MNSQILQLEKLIDYLLPFLEIKESSNNPKAVGDNGKARGILQIHQIFVDDVNRIYESNFTWDDCWSKSLSEQIVKLYLVHYGQRYMDKEKQDLTIDVLARLHQGGPDGYKHTSTVPYWHAVNQIIRHSEITNM